MSLGISHGTTQVQKDTFRDYAQQVEQAVGSRERLGALIPQIDAADLAVFDREQLLGRVEQYRLDLMNAAGELDDLEVDDGGAGGSEG